MGAPRLMDPTKEQEAAWRATLERLGESAVRFDLQMRQGVGIGMNNDVMHRFAFQWLRDKERERESRERVTVRYVKWTLVAAVAAVIIGVLAIIVTVMISR
jgi:hypothetical protein